VTTLIHDFVEQASLAFPEKCAVIMDKQQFSYMDIYHAMLAFAKQLQELRVKKGDRVLIALPNSLFSIITIFATSKIGAVFVHINEEVATTNLKYIMEDCTPEVIVTHSQFIRFHDLDWKRHKVVEVNQPSHDTISSGKITSLSAVSLDREDHACLIYTSGSTGRPKAVISSHANIVFAAKAIQKVISMQKEDILGLFVPFSFDYGLYQIFLTFQVGATLFISPKASVGTKMLKLINKYGITGLPIVPSMVKSISFQAMRENSEIRGLRFITSTGEKLNKSDIYELMNVFPKSQIFSMYGLTECKRVSILPSNEMITKIDSVGKPLPETNCWIIDKEGKPLPPYQVGQLIVGGPHVMQGYWNNEASTTIHFGNWNNQYVLFTGDICSLDDEGYLYFHGREDGMFKRRGYRLSSLEIELSVMDIPGVQQAALVLSEDGGECISLFVVSEHSSDYIYKELKRTLEKYKLPDQIINVTTFPLTLHGKVDKMKLRKMLAQGVTL
jgi:amino acid adenylation domain-containing protein